MASAADRKGHVAAGLATAMLAGPWGRAAMLVRCRRALDRDRSPQWLLALVDQVLDAYRDAPRDRPRELAAYLQVCPAWRLAWQHRRVPHIVAWTPVATEQVRRPWPVVELADLGALAALLNVDQGELAWFADLHNLERHVGEPLRHYRWRVLPRRDGYRLVAAPKPRLKEIQRRLLRHVLAPIPLHDAAHGCVRGRSVVTALRPHAGADAVIRVDLESFFTSIPAGRIWALVREAGLPEAVAHTVTGLLTTVVPRQVWRALPETGDPQGARRLGRRLAIPHLPQGAPTSAATANLIAYRLDRRLAGLAGRFGAGYTRYVDDLIFSGGQLRTARARFVDAVRTIASSEGFTVNERKTVVLGGAGRQALLGAVINGHPTLPREERDVLRAILHNCAVRGWRSQLGEHAGPEELRAHLLGRISWLGALDPPRGARLRGAFALIDWS